MGQELPPGFVAVPGFPGGLPASEAEVLLHSLPKQRKVRGSTANGARGARIDVVCLPVPNPPS